MSKDITIPPSAKGKYDKYFAEKVSAIPKYPTAKIKLPYGLLISKISNPSTQYVYSILFDLSAFRPDIRDYVNFTEKDIEIIVLYEKVKYTNVISMIPRYILHGDNMFVNIR
jgi:hypothetical protein